MTVWIEGRRHTKKAFTAARRSGCNLNISLLSYYYYSYFLLHYCHFIYYFNYYYILSAQGAVCESEAGLPDIMLPIVSFSENAGLGQHGSCASRAVLTDSALPSY